MQFIINYTTEEETEIDNKDDLQSIISQIDTIAKSKAKTNRDGVANAITKHHGNANYNSITDIKIAKKVLSELENL